MLVSKALSDSFQLFFTPCSVKAVCHKDFSVGEEIELRLMRRERESLLPMPSASFSLKVLNEMQRVGSPNAATPFAKLIVASKEEASC